MSNGCLNMNNYNNAATFSILILLSICFSAPSWSDHHDDTLSIKEITKDSLYIITQNQPFGANHMGVLVGEENLMIIDTLPKIVRNQVVEAVKEISGKPPKFVFNTLIHDHRTGANNAFRNMGAEVIRARDEYPTWVDEEEGPAEIEFTAELKLRFADEWVTAWHHRIHTLGDSIIKLEKSNVIFTGWTYVSEILPQGTRSYIRQVELWDEILGMADDDTLIVPGYGKLSNKNQLQVYKDRFSRLRSQIVSLHKAGLSVDDIINNTEILDAVAEMSIRINNQEERLRNAEKYFLRIIVTSIVTEETYANDFRVANDRLYEYVGTYNEGDNKELDILILEDKLLLGSQSTQYYTAELHPYAEDEFYVANNGFLIKFNRNAKNQVIGMEINRQGQISMAIR